LWTIDMTTAYTDTLRLGRYVMDPYVTPNTVCVDIPGDGGTTCYGDSGWFDLSSLGRAADGTPTTLWATFAQGSYFPSEASSGWLHVGPFGAPAAGARVPEPISDFEFSGLEPNPAIPASRLRLSLPRAGDVTLEILDVSGRHRIGHVWRALDPGRHELPVPGLSALGPGIYFARVECAGHRAVRRVAVLR
jgi:hypothetical protein